MPPRETGSRLREAWSWLSGATTGARQLRVGAALVLLLWGTVDQARYYLSLRADNLRDLQRAARWIPLIVRCRFVWPGENWMKASRGSGSGVGKAIQANPADPAPRQALLRFLIEQERFDEALSLTDASLKYSPKDANLLVDRGLLALRRGHPDQAVDSWERAIAVDPGQLAAHLYLANELDHEGKAQAAAGHYEMFLNAVARQPVDNVRRRRR